jgi:hypothetical protein
LPNTKALAFSHLNEMNAVVAADQSLIFKGGSRPEAVRRCLSL